MKKIWENFTTQDYYDLESDYNALLILAVKNGDIYSARDLLTNEAYGVNVNFYKTNYDLNPLLIAINTGNIEMVRLLIENGADVNAQIEDCFSPLNLVIMHSNELGSHPTYYQIAQLLIDRDAQIYSDAIDHTKENLQAFISLGNCKDIVKYFLEHWEPMLEGGMMRDAVNEMLGQLSDQAQE